jgi:hypothetical protein
MKGLDYLFPPLEWTPCQIDHLGETPPQKILMGDPKEAPRLNNQSDRVSILRTGTSKDRSAKLWIIAEPAFSCLDYPVINSPVH